MSVGTPMSQRIATAWPPEARISSTVSWIVPGNSPVFASTVRAAHTTDAPWRPRYVASPLPIPREEPVTTITLPSNSGVVMPAS